MFQFYLPFQCPPFLPPCVRPSVPPSLHSCILQKKIAVGHYPQGNWRNLIPIKHMLSILTDIIVLPKRVHMTRPEVNIYMYALLTNKSLQ